MRPILFVLGIVCLTACGATSGVLETSTKVGHQVPNHAVSTQESGEGKMNEVLALERFDEDFWKLTDQSTHVAMVLKDDADRTLRLFTTHEHLRTVIGNSAQRSKGGPVFKVKSAQVSTEAGETVVDAELIDAGGGEGTSTASLRFRQSPISGSDSLGFFQITVPSERSVMDKVLVAREEAITRVFNSTKRLEGLLSMKKLGLER